MFIETSPSQKCCSCVSKNPVFLYLETRAFKHKERVISSLEQAGILSLTGEKRVFGASPLDEDSTSTRRKGNWRRKVFGERLSSRGMPARAFALVFAFSLLLLLGCFCFCLPLSFCLFWQRLLLLLLFFVGYFFLFLSAFVIVLAGFVFVFLFLSLWPLCLVCHFAWKFFGWLLLPWYIYCLLVCWC